MTEITKSTTLSSADSVRQGVLLQRGRVRHGRAQHPGVRQAQVRVPPVTLRAQFPGEGRHLRSVRSVQYSTLYSSALQYRVAAQYICEQGQGNQCQTPGFKFEELTG